jgi:hypothetical protein
MKFIIPLFVFVSLNATSQLTICTLESKPSWSDENLVTAFCLEPHTYIYKNDWYQYDYHTYDGVHFVNTCVHMVNTTRAMEINGNMVAVYQGSTVNKKNAFALYFQSNDHCILTPLECKKCIDDFEQSYFIDGTEHVALNVNYYSNPKIDFVINATKLDVNTNSSQEFQLRRCVYSTKEKMQIAVIWEIVGRKDISLYPPLLGGGQPLIEVDVISDNDSTYYFLTDGNGLLTIVKISKRGKIINLYNRRPGCDLTRQQNISVIETCCDKSELKFEIKK